MGDYGSMYSSAVKSLRQRRVDKMNILSPTFPVRFPNSQFTQPVDSPWSDWQLHLGDTAVLLTANRLGGERRIGAIIETIRTPRDLGQLIYSQIVDNVCSVWRPDDPVNGYVVIPFFQFWPSRINEMGVLKDDEAWFLTKVVTPVWYDFVPS